MSVPEAGQQPIRSYGMDTTTGSISFGQDIKLTNQYTTMNIFQRIIHHQDTVAVYIPGEGGSSSKVLVNMADAKKALGTLGGGTAQLTKSQMRFLLGTMYAESQSAQSKSIPQDRIAELVRQAKTHGTSRLGALAADTSIAKGTTIDMTRKDLDALYSAIERCGGNKAKAQAAIEGEPNGVKNWFHPSKSHAGEKIYAPTLEQLRGSLEKSDVTAQNVRESKLTDDEQSALLALLGEKGTDEGWEDLGAPSQQSPSRPPSTPLHTPPAPSPASPPRQNLWEGIAYAERSQAKIRSGRTEKQATWNDMSGLLDDPLKIAAESDIRGTTPLALQGEADRGDKALEILRYYKKNPESGNLISTIQLPARQTVIDTVKQLLVCVPDELRNASWLQTLLTHMQEASRS